MRPFSATNPVPPWPCGRSCPASLTGMIEEPRHVSTIHQTDLGPLEGTGPSPTTASVRSSIRFRM